jgi:hypothetical protein
MSIRSGKRVVSCGKTDVNDEVIVANRNFANALKEHGQF